MTGFIGLIVCIQLISGHCVYGEVIEVTEDMVIINQINNATVCFPQGTSEVAPQVLEEKIKHGIIHIPRNQIIKIKVDLQERKER